MKRTGNIDRLRRVLVLICGLVLPGTFTGAAASGPAAVDLRIDTISVFKNGLAYFHATSEIPRGAQEAVFGQLPIPAFGTFWVGFPEDLAVANLVTRLETVERRIPAGSIGQLIQLNEGRRVSLRVAGSRTTPITGKIVKGTGSERSRPPVSPYLMGAVRTPDQRSILPPDRLTAQVVIVETEDGLVAVNAGSIEEVHFERDDIETAAVVEDQRPVVVMELAEPAPDAEVSVSYLAKGLTWSPSYLIDLTDPETALFTAKAYIINEVADIEGVALELVTGFPNIKYGDLHSPLAMTQDLASFLMSLQTGRIDSGGLQSQMIRQVQAPLLSNVAAYSMEAPPLPSYGAVAAGQVAEDLFLYPVADFSLRRGETALIPLFTAELPYRHIYTWTIPDFVDPSGYYRAAAGPDDGGQIEEVWHSCRLQNSMDMPLTTAAVEFTTDARFTGQDICYYTAPGARTTIHINKALNILAEQTEFEVERQRGSARFYGHSYDLVKVQGELGLRSRLQKTVDVEITKELSGEVLGDPAGAKDVTTAKGLKQANPKHVLTWEIELEPGQKKTLAYTYQVYIRN